MIRRNTYRPIILLSVFLAMASWVVLGNTKVANAYSFCSPSSPITNCIPNHLPYDSSNTSNQSYPANYLYYYDTNASGNSNCYNSNAQDPAITEWISQQSDPTKDVTQQPIIVKTPTTQIPLMLNDVLMWCRKANSPNETLYNYVGGSSSGLVGGVGSAPVNADLNSNNSLNMNEMYVRSVQNATILGANKIVVTGTPGLGPGSIINLSPSQSGMQRYWEDGIQFTLDLSTYIPPNSKVTIEIPITTVLINEWHGSYYCVIPSNQPEPTLSAAQLRCGTTQQTLVILIQTPASNWSLASKSTVGGSCTSTSSANSMTVKRGQKVTFYHCVTNTEPDDMSQSFTTNTEWTTSAPGEPPIAGQPATNQALTGNTTTTVNTNTFTVPNNAANGVTYCQNVKYTPQSSTSTSTGSSTPACVTVQYTPPPPPPNTVNLSGTVNVKGGFLPNSVTVQVCNCGGLCGPKNPNVSSYDTNVPKGEAKIPANSTGIGYTFTVDKAKDACISVLYSPKGYTLTLNQNVAGSNNVQIKGQEYTIMPADTNISGLNFTYQKITTLCTASTCPKSPTATSKLTETCSANTAVSGNVTFNQPVTYPQTDNITWGAVASQNNPNTQTTQQNGVELNPVGAGPRGGPTNKLISTTYQSFTSSESTSPSVPPPPAQQDASAANNYVYTVVTLYSKTTNGPYPVAYSPPKYTGTGKNKKEVYQKEYTITATYEIKTYQEEFTQWTLPPTAPPNANIVLFSIGQVVVYDNYGNYTFGPCDGYAPTISTLTQVCSPSTPYVSYSTNDQDGGLNSGDMSSTVDGYPNHAAPSTTQVSMENYDQLINHIVTVTVYDVNQNGTIAPPGTANSSSSQYGWNPVTQTINYVPCWQPTCDQYSGGANIQVAPVTEYNKNVSVTVDVGFLGIGPGVQGDHVLGSANPGAGITVYNYPDPPPPTEPTPTLDITLTPSGNPISQDPVTGQAASDGTVTYNTGPSGLASADYTVSWVFNSPASGDTIGSSTSPTIGCGDKTFVVAYEPYFRVYGGDISGGNGIDLTNTGTCRPNTSSNSVIGYNEDGGQYGYSGAGSQYAAYGTGAYAITHIAGITGFATGDGASGGPPGGSPYLLSFGNTSASPTQDNFGGNYSGNLPCIPNYYTAPIASGATNFTCSGSITIANGQLPSQCTNPSGSSGNLSNMTGRVIVKVNGDVHITGTTGPTFNTSTMWGGLQSGTGGQNNAPLVNKRHIRQYSCGNNQVYHVAPNATSVNISAIGGQGGGGGAYGSQVTNTISVPPGTSTLTVDVGCPGNGTSGGSGYQSGGNGTSSPGYYYQEPGYGYSYYNPPVCFTGNTGYWWPGYGLYLVWINTGVQTVCYGGGWRYVYVPGPTVYVPGVSGNGGGGSSAVLNGSSLMLSAAGGAGSGAYAGAGGGSNYAGTSAPGYSPSIDQQASTPGSVSISSNVPFNSGHNISQVPPPNTTSVSLNIPSLYIVAKGNIYIDPTVNQMFGVYVAEGATDNGQGVIYTCNEPINQSYYNNCNSNAPLVVNGAFIAGRVAMGRTYGTADQGAPGDTAGNPGSGWNNAAEVFNYTPALWLNNPFASTSNTYDAISNLPPVL